MKQGRLLNKILMSALFLALCAYLGIYIYNGLTDPFQSVLCYTHTVDDTVETTGYVVRQETLLPVQQGVVDLLPEEGEKVAKNEVVAMVYRDEADLERKSEIRQLELELEQLEYSLRRDSSTADSGKLDQNILATMVDLRAATAAGDYSRLEEDAMELKNMIFRRSYTYQNSTESVEAINAMMDSVSAQLKQRRAETSQSAVSVYAPQSGIFSGQIDGYESILTPANVEKLTPSQLDELQPWNGDDGSGQTGKLITSSRWYFVVALQAEQAQRLVEGEQVLVRFSRDYTGDVSMLVERIGAPQGGRVAVVFSSTRFLSEITLLRRQTVEILFDSVSGIRVPKNALRVLETAPGNESGEPGRQTGVYAVVGMQAEWKPVTILAEEEDHVLVHPAPFANEQDKHETKKALRSGDEIIVNADGLYDGKVVK